MKVTISFAIHPNVVFSANTSVAALLTYEPEGFDRLIYNLPLPLLIAAIADCPVLAAAISHTRGAAFGAISQFYESQVKSKW